MPLTVGPQESPAAIFIFKSDETNQLAWDDAIDIARKDATSTERDHARVELHTKRASFLAGLKAWQEAIADPENAHLLVYAHGGVAGIAPTQTPGDLVTWQDLKDALARGVAVLWIVGCKSEHVLKSWVIPSASPVKSSLLVTTADMKWFELIPRFSTEVDIENFVFFDTMRSSLIRQSKHLGQEVRYLDASQAAWEDFPEREDAAGGQTSSPTADELSSLWTTPDVE